MNRTAVIVIATFVVFAGATAGFANGQGESVSLLGDEETAIVTFDVNADADDPAVETLSNGHAPSGNETDAVHDLQSGGDDQTASNSSEPSTTDETDTSPVIETAVNSSDATNGTESTALETGNSVTENVTEASADLNTSIEPSEASSNVSNSSAGESTVLESNITAESNEPAETVAGELGVSNPHSDEGDPIGPSNITISDTSENNLETATNETGDTGTADGTGLSESAGPANTTTAQTVGETDSTTDSENETELALMDSESADEATVNTDRINSTSDGDEQGATTDSESK